MALIFCPDCGKAISDRAKKCTGCGRSMVQESIDEPVAVRVCEECGTELPDGVDSCPSCGCPVAQASDTDNTDSMGSCTESAACTDPETPESTESGLKQKKIGKQKQIIIAAIATVAIIALIIGVVGFRNYSTRKVANQYISDYQEVSELMFEGCVDAENICVLVHDVWYNTIFKKDSSVTDAFTKKNGEFRDDFNDALFALFVDTSYMAKKMDIEDNQEQVEAMMQNLINPPEQYTQAYLELKDFYSSYQELLNLAQNPTGTLTTYTENYNNVDNQIVSKYNSVKLYFNEEASKSVADEKIKDSPFTQEEIDAVERYVKDAATAAVKEYGVTVDSVSLSLEKAENSVVYDGYDLTIYGSGVGLTDADKVLICEAIDEIHSWDVEKATGLDGRDIIFYIRIDVGGGNLMIHEDGGKITLFEGHDIPLFDVPRDDLFGK